MENWTDEEYQRAVAMATQGKTYRQISEILGRNMYSVSSKMKRERLKPSKPILPENRFDDKIRDMFGRGLSANRMALSIGMSAGWVRRRVNLIGLERVPDANFFRHADKIRECYGNNMKPNDIAELLGLSVPTVRTYARSMGLKYSLTIVAHKDDETIHQMRVKGCTYEEIGKALGRNPKSVARRGYRIGASGHGAALAARNADPAVLVLEAAQTEEAAVAAAARRPGVYSRETEDWAFANPQDPEGSMIIMHLVQNGNITPRAAVAEIMKRRSSPKACGRAEMVS